MQRLLSMQSDSSFLVRAKAQSVFRACVEQMEMYKDTEMYQDAVRSFIESAMGPWMDRLNQNLNVDVASLAGDEFNNAVKLKYGTHKVRPRKFDIDYRRLCCWKEHFQLHCDNIRILFLTLPSHVSNLFIHNTVNIFVHQPSLYN